MRSVFVVFSILTGFFTSSYGQEIVYSERINKDRSSEIVFEIIGKYNNNFLVYKKSNVAQHITVYNNDMTIKDHIKLDYITDRVFNVDFVPYRDFFYMIYQYTRKGVVHCVSVKIDSAGRRLTEPADIDTTAIGFMGESKIYTTTFSEDKQKILVYKVHKKEGRHSLVTLLFNNEMKLLQRSRTMVDLDERKKVYSDIQVDNEGDIVFTESTKGSSREFIRYLNIITKPAMLDSFRITKVNLDDKYTDEISIKVDNLNRAYLLNTFYYKNSRGSIEGLATAIWDKSTGTLRPTRFMEFDATFRNQAKRSGQARFAFDDYFIRNIVLKKDGGFILTAEDYSFQTRGINNWSRWDYLFNSPFYNNFYYLNSPSYYNFYNPFRSPFGSNQSIRHYYDNIMLLSVDNQGAYQWSAVIQKEQFDDENDNYLSYSTMVNAGLIHFLYNDNRSNEIVHNESVNGKGEMVRNPTLKSREKGYKFMARYSKQTGANQMLVPCNYRGTICFARVDF